MLNDSAAWTGEIARYLLICMVFVGVSAMVRMQRHIHVDLVYRLQRPEQLKPAVEEDPYWMAGAWTGYTPRSFSNFVEPWQAAEIVLDGSRTATIVEGPVSDADMAEFVLIEMRGRQQIAFGGLFADGETLAICKTPDAATAIGWFAESGFWAAERLHARPLLWVL